jgi:hypothetical protein
MNGEDLAALRDFEAYFSRPPKEIFVQDVALLQSASLSPAAVHGYLKRWNEAAGFEDQARIVRMLRYLPHGFTGEGWYSPLNDELRGRVLRWSEEALARNSEVELANRLRQSAWLKSAPAPVTTPHLRLPVSPQKEKGPAPASGPCIRLFRWLKSQG